MNARCEYRLNRLRQQFSVNLYEKRVTAGETVANQFVTVNDIKCAGRLNDNIDSTFGWLK